MSSVVRWPAEAIWEAVSPGLPGFSVEVLPQIDSTNSELMRRARAGLAEPVLLVAEQQTAGRGRLGRQWVSDVGESFAAGPPQGETAPSGLEPAAPSLLEQAWTGDRDEASRESRPARPRAVRTAFSKSGVATSVEATSSLTFSLGLPLAPLDWSGLSLAVGVSVAQSLHPDLRLKWPNDLWWQGRKLAGILIETATVGQNPACRYAVVGVGINIQAPQASGLATPPAWLQEVLPGVDAAQALLRIAAALVQTLKTFEEHGFAPFLGAFNTRDALRGMAITLSDGGSGIAQGVDGSGALRVQTAQGLKIITSSEVSVRLHAGPPAVS